MTLPRDIFTGKMPRVYDTILSLGGVLIPMQKDMDGNVLAYYPDGSTLALAPTLGVDFTHDGKIPHVAGGSPRATFSNADDGIGTTVAQGDLFQLRTGTWQFLVTPEYGGVSYPVLAQKTSNATGLTRQGWKFFLTESRKLSAELSAGPNGSANHSTAVPVFDYGSTFVATYTHDGSTLKMYMNETEVKSAATFSLVDIAGSLTIGNLVNPNDSVMLGGMGFAAFYNGVILDAPKIQAIVAQCGPLG